LLLESADEKKQPWGCFLFVGCWKDGLVKR